MKKKILIAISILVLTCAVIAIFFYNRIYGPNVKETSFIFIPTGTNFKGLQEIVAPHLDNAKSFVWVAQKKQYTKGIRAGKFKITEGMSNQELINHLRGGKQETVKLTFNNQDTFEKLAGRIASQVEADSLSLLKVMREASFYEENQLDLQTALVMYIPNTYDFYWNTSAEDFRQRMLKEYNRFWNDERKELAKKQAMNPVQVSTLASIVQKETAVVQERKRVAGLYLNRLNDFMPLQADPTIIFALKQKYGQDKEFKRVLNKDLNIDSPYNTYSNFGLPPGPIGMPDISSIEAVLRPENHKYYYMCADVEKLGYHKFAESLQQHNVNARAYHKWVSEQGINR